MTPDPAKLKWEVKFLPFGGKKPWFAYHPDKTITHHGTWAEAMARVIEEVANEVSRPVS